MPREYYVYPNGNQIPIAGTCEYATQLPMSAGDPTDVYTAISGKADNVNLPAVQGGTDNTLVTTGDKYNWDNNDASSKVSKSGDTMTGALNMAGQDVVLNTTGSSSNDSGDLVWKYGNGNEKSRIWTANAYTATCGPNYRVYKEDGTSLYSGYLALGDSVGNASVANTCYGIYTLNGGQQGPGYFGKNRAGFLMSNATVAGDSHYKNWLYMDNYNGNDVGGATALGLDRNEPRAFIMQSDASRSAWNNTAALGVFTATPTSAQMVVTDGTTGGIKSSGYGYSTSATGNTVALRQANGYIYATYYNQSSGAESPTTSSYIIYCNSDGFFRKSSLNGIINVLPTVSAATTATYGKLTLAGTTTNYTAKSFTIPAAAYEIVIACVYTSASKLFCTSLPKGVLTTSNRELWVSGGRGNSLGSMNDDSARCLCNVKISGTTFTLQGVSCTNAGTPNEACTWYVYYR